MNVCPNCGGNLEDIENFCPLCGSKLSEIIKTSNVSDDRDQIIDELKSRVLFLERKQNYPKNSQVEQLKREINELKTLIRDSKTNSQKKKSGNDGTIACCCFAIIIIVLFFMFMNPFLFIGGF